MDTWKPQTERQDESPWSSVEMEEGVVHLLSRNNKWVLSGSLLYRSTTVDSQGVTSLTDRTYRMALRTVHRSGTLYGPRVTRKLTE